MPYARQSFRRADIVVTLSIQDQARAAIAAHSQDPQRTRSQAIRTALVQIAGIVEDVNLIG